MTRLENYTKNENRKKIYHQLTLLVHLVVADLPTLAYQCVPNRRLFIVGMFLPKPNKHKQTKNNGKQALPCSIRNSQLDEDTEDPYRPHEF